MSQATTPSASQLKSAIRIAEQIEELQAKLAQILGSQSGAVVSTGKATKPAGRRKSAAKRTLSPEGRARIIAAQKARWAKAKKAS